MGLRDQTAHGSYRGSVVQTVTDDRTGKSAQIRFDRSKEVFWTVIGEDFFRESSLSPVRQWAQQRLKLSDEVVWEPVMEFSASDVERRAYRRSRMDEEEITAELSFSMTRYYVGRTENGKWYQTSWESMNEDSAHYLEPEHRLASAQRWSTGSDKEDPNHWSNRRSDRTLTHKLPRFKLPHIDGDTRYLPYDEEAWNGARAIVENIEKTRGTLYALLSRKHAVKNLQAIAAGNKQLLLGKGS